MSSSNILNLTIIHYIHKKLKRIFKQLYIKTKSKFYYYKTKRTIREYILRNNPNIITSENTSAVREALVEQARRYLENISAGSPIIPYESSIQAHMRASAIQIQIGHMHQGGNDIITGDSIIDFREPMGNNSQPQK